MDAALNQTARALVAPGKGILAADESTGTIKKRFESIKAESTADSRRDYREMMFRADADPFFFTLNSWGAALIYFTARDLLAPSPAPNAAKDRERFTRSLLQMGNRALAPSERRSSTAKASMIGRAAGRGRG